MRASFIAFVVVAALASSAVAQETPECPLGDGYEFVPELSDEFNSDSLDSSKWWDFNPAWRGRKPALFSRRNVEVSDGALRLTASLMKPEEVDVENAARGYDKYWKAIVKSKTKGCYGYYEARCKSMRACVCNAFWLYDPFSDRPDIKYVEGEFSEEIDILEYCGKPNDKGFERVYYATIHRYATPYLESIVNKKKFKTPNYAYKEKMDFDFGADYHTFGLAWTPDALRWYVDGREVFARENDFFRRPLHIMLDCEIMSDWFGEPNPEDLPATFSIDYVRVWRLKDAPEPEALPEKK
ncbi:MAG: family 16 glycosylhydrolase [Thermoguttaceae bacterium]|nr:family 16 glycosylhydrolase [Thermoguttaceae bacterium]